MSYGKIAFGIVQFTREFIDTSLEDLLFVLNALQSGFEQMNGRLDRWKGENERTIFGFTRSIMFISSQTRERDRESMCTSMGRAANEPSCLSTSHIPGGISAKRDDRRLCSTKETYVIVILVSSLRWIEETEWSDLGKAVDDE